MNLLASLFQVFNNRELAMLIWLIVFAGWALTMPKIRRSFIQVVKLFCAFKILTPLALILASVGVFLWILCRFGLWDFSFLKDTIIWVFGVAIVMFTNINRAIEEDTFFKSQIVGLFSLVLILEFISNLYAFSLLVEILIFPLILVIGGVYAFTETDEGNRVVHRLLEWILVIYGSNVLLFSIYKAVRNFQSLMSFKNVQSFLLSPVLTIWIIPAIYLFALYARYELVFVRLDIINKDRDLVRHAKSRILLRFHLNLRGLNRWSRSVGAMRLDTKADVENMLGK